MIPIAARGIFAFIGMTCLIAMILAVLRVSLAVTLALSISRVSQRSGRAADQCKACNGGNQ
jgi:hypothetical protein